MEREDKNRHQHATNNKVACLKQLEVSP